MEIKLTDLEPCFLKRTDDNGFSTMDSIEGADGILFLCPLCFKNNNRSNIGVHSVICWQPNVPQSTSPTGGRWELIGTGFEDLTLKAGSSSILLRGGCDGHFFIQGGLIRLV